MCEKSTIHLPNKRAHYMFSLDSAIHEDMLGSSKLKRHSILLKDIPFFLLSFHKGYEERLVETLLTRRSLTTRPYVCPSCRGAVQLNITYNVIQILDLVGYCSLSNHANSSAQSCLSLYPPLLTETASVMDGGTVALAMVQSQTEFGATYRPRRLRQLRFNNRIRMSSISA
ncbi:unnamed protein product [Protopolystoma xenopodis]|uniref:Uncharacterized protein n=1 Tax=Protopolystoma xenopodis TaxID=117903 RepID=A0A3S5AUY3_9PLAT|nr:unnamed protein product [Protopolystoma xenopodis]